MRFSHQYAAHLLGLFLLGSALNTDIPTHPTLWVAALGLVAIPVLFEMNALRQQTL